MRTALAEIQSFDDALQPTLRLRRLVLRRFRNYHHLDLTLDERPVVLTGDNGAGKTNLLEAVSLLAPGRGLRRARLGELDRHGDGGPWSIAALLEGRDGPLEVATARVPESERRSIAIDGRTARGKAVLTGLGGIVWLTPAQDRLFEEAPAARRRFLDRLVLAIDPEHARRVSSYERLLRERGLLLREGRGDPAWLRALEGRIAETGVAVAAARRDLLAGLNTALADAVSSFPRARLTLAGEVESWLDAMPALAAEQKLAEALAASRPQDAEAGGARVGPHRTDLLVQDVASGLPAEGCSTGRQKSLLVSIVLAEARLRQRRLGELPILLLDEIAAHLDARRRGELMTALLELGVQAWLTGTDAELFAALRGRARFLKVHEAKLTPDDDD